MAAPTISATNGHPAKLSSRYLESALEIASFQQQTAQVRTQLSEEQARLQGGNAAAVSGLLAIIVLLHKRLSLQGQIGRASQALKPYTLPSQALAPGLAAHLCGSSSAALATLFDLAQRGFLRIEERESKWGQRFFEIIRQPSQDPLQPHEEAFLDALFRHTQKDRISLSQVAKLSYSKSFPRALDDELILRGWRSVERVDQRYQFAFLLGTIMSIGLFLFAVGIGIGWTHLLGTILIVSGGGFILSGFGSLTLTLSLSTLTDEGMRQAAQWNAFACYLKGISQNKVQHLNSEAFDRYLPVAAGFGFVNQWVSYFSEQPQLTIPDWLHSLDSSDLRSSMDAFFAMILAVSAADASYPSVAKEGGCSETVLSSIR